MSPEDEKTEAEVAKEEPPVEEPPVEEPPAEKTPADDQKVQDAPPEESKTEEIPSEEPAIDEKPPAEEAPLDEPETDDEPEMEVEIPTDSTPGFEAAPEEQEEKKDPVPPKPKKERKRMVKGKRDDDQQKAPPALKDVSQDGPVMRHIAIDKVVVNIGAGAGGEELQRAEKVIDLITKGRKAVRTISQTTNKDWGIRKKSPIACKVTLRGDEADRFLQEAFWVRDNKLMGYSFDREGNFSFGIRDYTDFPGMRYDPDIGIYGMDISVTMARPGRRVRLRRNRAGRIGKNHRVTVQETKSFISKRFSVEVID